MRLETQRELLDRVARHRDAGTTDMAPHGLRVAARHYVSAEQARTELSELFRRRPLLVALSPDLPQPGSYVTHEAAEVGLLLVRDDARRVRAFVNACRHRGARIAEGRGSRRAFTCPFHAWSYGRDGRVIARPNSCGGFDRVDASFDVLHELPSLETHGLIFVLLEGDDLEQQVQDTVGGVLDELDGYRIADTNHFDGRVTERDCNYKLIVDGFAESYHINALHQKTIAPYYYTAPALSDRFGRTIRMIGVRSSVENELTKPADEQRFLRHGTTQYLIPPNIVLTHQVDHIQLWQMYPVDGRPDRCRIHFNLYWPSPLDAEAERKSRFNVDVIWKVVSEEDFPQSLAIHKNLASGLLPELVFGRNEPALIHYHEQIARTLDSDAVRVVA